MIILDACRPKGATALIITSMLLLIAACGDSATAGQTRPGVAAAKVAHLEWQVIGTCDKEGVDMTFVSPGDPLLSIGFVDTDKPSAVGTIRSLRDGVVAFIGHPEVAAPTVTIDANTYVVKGQFFVDQDVHVDGEVTVTCE